ncbi:MAG: WecB/TagA/CpsF family glycosyltransferase, partial [Candidatus Staskawiczbacteria bacterium]|nr:WecB/TagA/CpsF family glycosyltransferase [Candidatus Staskawiczbacteria bacterium]
FIIQPGVISSLTYNFLICTQRPYEGLGHVAAEIQTFGMAGTRPTGLGRYAGVIGIVALANFLCIKNDKKLSKFFLFFIFIIFFLILVFAKGRTEIIGFIIAMVFVIWLAKKFNFYIILGTGLIILLVGFSIFYNIPCTNSIGIVNQLLPKNNMNNTPNSTLNITALNSTSPKNILNNLEPKNKLIFFTLSGRTTGIWPQSWRLFLSSPLIGYGFQADRVFLNGQHTHNTLFQALVQTGLLGTIPLIFAFLLTFIYLCYALKTKNIKEEEKCFLVVISGVFVFFAVRAITESSGAYFDADWLFLAPIIAYIQVYNDKKSDNYIENNLINLSGNKIKIVVTGMHGLVQSNKNPEFKNMLNSADLFVPDGISLVILGKLHGFDIKKRVSGADLMSAFFMEAEKKGHSNFFYGDTDDTLKDLKTKLLQKFPNLNIAGMYSPPFRKLTKQEDKEMIKMINNTKPDVLWVGLGLPKQENWIFENKEKLDVSVLVGVGAAFKFLSGRVKRAPEWLGNLGFEWLWRLVFETKTVWRRIFLDGPFFFLIIIKDFFKFNLKKQMINIIRSTVKSLLMFIEKFCLFPIGIIMGNKLLEQLIPYDVEGFEEKIRLGNLSDGGYVIPSKILSLIEVEYCYGVADYIDFEEDLMKSFDVPIRFYDHTIKSLPIKNKNFFFKKQGIAAKKYGDFDTFYNHLR